MLALFDNNFKTAIIKKKYFNEQLGTFLKQKKKKKKKIMGKERNI